jgi:hypothetical protein
MWVFCPIRDGEVSWKCLEATGQKYALWGFEDAFGITDHDQPGVKYEEIMGYDVDRKLLELMMEAQVTD